MAKPTVWGIHAGASGEADSDFLEGGIVGMGWAKLGDLSHHARSRDTLKAWVRESYPEYKEGRVPVVAGMLYRFVHEIKEGDYVVYPRKADRTLRLGRVTGPYAHRQGLVFPNVRPCKWEAERPRTAFAQAALYEVGSAMSFFQIREHADHFLSVFSGAITVEDPEPVSFDPQESTQDFIIRRLEFQLKGAPLERFVKDLLEAMGYRCRLTRASGDGGVDVVASRGPLGFEPPIIRAQVKSTTGTIGDAPVKHLFASVNSGEFALFVTLGGFTKAATEFARSKPNLSLISGNDFVELVLEHYEELSPASKALIPLKRSYIPDTEPDTV